MKCSLGVVSVQVVRCGEGGTVRGGDLVTCTLGVVSVQGVRWCEGGTVRGGVW